MPPAAEVQAEAGTPGPAYGYLQIASTPAGTSALDCTTEAAPGPDIDAAALFSGPAMGDVVATLAQCRWLDAPGRCPTNAHQEAAAAEGPEDSTPFDGFVSLNGGSLLCALSGGARLELGMIVVVYEVGSAVEPEPFAVRACEDEALSTCGTFEESEGGLTLPAGKLLF